MGLTRSIRLSLGAALCLLPVFAFAHPGHDESGLMAGVAHPLSGMDHLLAMFAVGLWAAQQAGKARLMLPLIFVAGMLLGGLLGFEGFAIAHLETGIAASVLAFGLLVAVAARPPVALALAITGLFGLAHGIAHGMEFPEMSSPAAYAVGFLIATSALHAAGFALARGLPMRAAALVRALGLVSAGAGITLLAG
ncbi:HupE/UreJ family protein [Pseudomonas bijieensis]|uniref:HupE/UreJ family protein n=1 Tax=Pseudomonas bijieensis TaxID=2681983 RepID=UPI001E5E0839|nr:HupE/UreJ family protein [Pseudomonas bijieensis]MCD9113864.1 HupE/UreJ family protein [Pseudomonas bijieensis]MCD9118610.1 HupE/UreJ family protein [Pseudomonas bijieensis]